MKALRKGTKVRFKFGGEYRVGTLTGKTYEWRNSSGKLISAYQVRARLPIYPFQKKSRTRMVKSLYLKSQLKIV